MAGTGVSLVWKAEFHSAKGRGHWQWQTITAITTAHGISIDISQANGCVIVISHKIRTIDFVGKKG